MSGARVIFLTGLSGAGRSQAVKTLEDLGFYCVEHLPPAALAVTLATLDRAHVHDVAVALDMHADSALGDALAAIETTRSERDVSLVYFDARDETLVRRFSETRRRHPLAHIGSLPDAIIAERAALLPLRERADHVIDTTQLTHGALKARLTSSFSPNAHAALAITLVPFGFKFGLPLDLDLLFDVRFLRNPNYEKQLRSLTGDDAAVAAYIEADPDCAPFIERVTALLDFLIPRFVREGKARLTIGIGCTGGRHRSVYLASRLQDHFASHADLALSVDARDVVR